MVAERFVYLRRFIVIWIEKIKNENIDMSSEKQWSTKLDQEQLSPKVQGFSGTAKLPETSTGP